MSSAIALLLMNLILAGQSAIADCKPGMKDHAGYDAQWRIDSYGIRINGLRQQNVADTTELNNHLQPELATWEYNVQVVRTGIENLKRAESAVKSVLGYIQDTVIVDQELLFNLQLLQEEMARAQGQRLSDRLRVVAQSSNADAATAEHLRQLANAVEHLETSMPDWLAAEADILAKYLRGSDLAQELNARLERETQHIANDILQMKESLKDGEGKRLNRTRAVNETQTRIAVRQKEIEVLTKEIADNYRILNQWRAGNCNRPSPPPKYPPFGDVL